MLKFSVFSPSILSFLFILLLSPTFSSALITRQVGDVDEEKQGQTVVSTDIGGTKSHASSSPKPEPTQTASKSIVPGWDDSLTIACIVGGISLIAVVPMFVYIWRRRRRLRRARALPRNPDNIALVNRKESFATVDGHESPLPSPHRKLGRPGTGVSFASEVTVMDQVPKPQPVFHAM
ncbi:hypothetical protein L873DRAFT_1787310 [Choiromyces venosus 120613-1]|uniref:Mid2 domain-containing protein n=1 Tax=Choiromyces venosus 120613-1 TaxID=1336337 RepID=A0A3N4JY20_9PEZI|nr:hypothetical protein L873DRAFT_1787310 [Choiromyces venosus 120613-1]